MQKKLTSILLLFSIGTILASSCGESPSEVPAVTTDGGQSSAVETESGIESDELPAGLNFNGETINVLYRDDVVNSFYVDEQTGDIVDDAVYNSNRAVEERLGVKFNIITQAGTANADRNNYLAFITNSVLAGDNAYDLCGVLTYNIPTLIQQGVLTDLLGVKYLNFDKPWWTSDLTELATIGGKLYFASGDITLELTQRIFCMLFNKELAESLNVEDIYSLVNDGKWTLDKMKEIGTAAYADLDGDSVVSTGDRFGVVANDYNHITSFMASLEPVFTMIGDDGRQHICGDSEHTVDVMSRIVDVFNNNNGIFYMNKSDANPSDVASNHEVYRSMFKSDNILIITSEFHQISSVFRDMQSDYGIIPYPKYDEEQENYYTLARNVYSSMVIPKTCDKLDAVGAAMEAMASQNYRDVSPVYFETALKVKYSRDDVASQMYDLIKQGLRFNFAFTFSAVSGGFANIFADMVGSNDENYMSKYESINVKKETELQKFYDDVESFE